MSSSNRPRKRQSRLAFTPLPSSSPAAKEYNKQIQERAAAVTLDSSPGPSKRRKIGSQLDGAHDILPTPVATNQRLRERFTGEDSEGEAPPLSARHKSKTYSRKKARQQRLDFSNVRDADSFSPPMKLSSPSRPQSSARAGMFGTQKKRAVVNISSDEESNVEGNGNYEDPKSDDDEELPSPRKLLATPQTKSKNSALQTAGRPTRATRSSQPIAIDADSANEIVVSSKPPSAVTIESEDEDEEDDMPTTLGTQRRRRARRKSPDSFIASSPPRVVDSDSDLEIVEPPKKKRRATGRHESDDVDELETPRRLKRGRGVSQREKEELEEDLDFLEPSSDVESPPMKRDTQSQKKNARQQALDKLKRRRSKQVEVSDDQESEQHGAHASFDELYDDDDAEEYAQQHPPPLKSSQMFREDEWDEGFIDEDEGEDDPLGIPEGMPLEYTRHASKKPKELFKHAIDWFIQKKINPAFSRDDAIYRLAFDKLDREVAGLAGSKFTSAAWTPEFTMALNARPQIAWDTLDAETVWMHDTCDACNRSRHPATYQIQFQGKPYHPETLEDVAGNDDDDDEDNDVDSSSETSNNDEDAVTYDVKGRQIPPETKIYYVGKFCMANAKMAHALQHWKYHLNEWVVEWLDKEEYNIPEQIVRRDRWDTAKRRKYANKIADRLEAEGEVKKLYRDFRKEVGEARDSKQGRYGGFDED